MSQILEDGPPPERWHHGRVSRESAQLVDARGDIGFPWRAEGLLARLERKGDIDARQRAAGEAFQNLFRIAQLDPLRAADMGQRIQSAFPAPHRSEWARRKLVGALDVLGGHGSPCGACAWYVLGCELSIREWAMRQGWGGKPVNQHMAKGTLLGALAVLAHHFGL
jgi:hypothetical protein